MPGISGIPLPTIPTAPSDLPPEAFPTLTRIATRDPVGPSAANRQHRANEKRTVTLATLLQQIATQLNLIDQFYLRRDGSPQAGAAPNAGFTGNISLNGFRITSSADPVDPGDLVPMDWAVARAGDVMTGELGLPAQDDTTPSEVAARIDYVRLLVNNALSSLAPVGTYGFFDSTTPPAGRWLRADGTLFTSTGYYAPGALSQAAYPFVDGGANVADFAALDALRTKLGSKYGGNGTTSFRLPPFAGRWPCGAGINAFPGVLRIKVTANGSNYSSAPTVVISAPTGPGGVQATATAVIESGRLIDFVITNPGSGYLTTPTVNLTGGGGSGAAAQAELQPTTTRTVGELFGTSYAVLKANNNAYHTHAAPRESGNSRRERDGGTGVEGMGSTGGSGDNEPVLTIPASIATLICIRY